MGTGMKSLKWEGIGTENRFPHTSSPDPLNAEAGHTEHTHCIGHARVSVTTWLAAAKLGRLVLGQFVRREHSHRSTRVQNSVQLSSCAVDISQRHRYPRTILEAQEPFTPISCCAQETAALCVARLRAAALVRMLRALLPSLAQQRIVRVNGPLHSHSNFRSIRYRVGEQRFATPGDAVTACGPSHRHRLWYQ